jgi:putative RecB family exonuclease
MTVTSDGPIGGADLSPPEYLSPSSVSTWQQCPLKFKYSRIDKLTDPPTDATVLGNFVHDVLEALLRLPGPERTLPAARSLMRNLWESEYEVKAEDVLAGAKSTSLLAAAIHEFRWKAWWCIENYFTMEDPVTVAFDGLEDYVVGAIGRVPMRGYIDRWHRGDTGIVIGDYKTGKTPRPQWRGDKFQQLAIYALLLESIHDEPVARMELLYLKDGVRLTQPVEPPALTAVAETIDQVYGELLTACETGDFPTKKARLCDWCSYKTFCPAWV